MQFASEEARKEAEFIKKMLLEHPDWVKTATVETDNGTIRLIHVISSSTVIGFNPTSNEKFYFPIGSPFVESVKWVRGGHTLSKPGKEL